MAGIMDECQQTSTACTELKQLMHNPMFSTLRETLASDVIQQSVPYTLVNSKTDEKDLDLHNFDLVVEDATLQAEFRQLSPLCNPKVAELEGFYNTQSVSVITQRTDAMAKVSAGGYNNSRVEQELKCVAEYYDKQQAHLTLRISKSLQLLKQTLPLELAQPGGATKKNKSRNLCSKAVKIMQDWYDKHVDHPYPTDQEKQDMADDGGLTLAQVKAWFANKRNRSLNTKPKRKKLKLQQQLSSICQNLITGELDKGPMEPDSSSTYPPKTKAHRYEMLISELSTIVQAPQRPFSHMEYPSQYNYDVKSDGKGGSDFSSTPSVLGCNGLQTVN